MDLKNVVNCIKTLNKDNTININTYIVKCRGIPKLFKTMKIDNLWCDGLSFRDSMVSKCLEHMNKNHIHVINTVM